MFISMGFKFKGNEILEERIRLNKGSRDKEAPPY